MSEPRKETCDVEALPSSLGGMLLGHAPPQPKELPSVIDRALRNLVSKRSFAKVTRVPVKRARADAQQTTGLSLRVACVAFYVRLLVYHR